MADLRLQMNAEDLDQVRSALLERSGDINLVKVETPPQVVEVDVAEGVQTIRIQIG